MYPAFIKKAQEEGNAKAVQVFTRAKLAESVHAERYLAAYNDLDAADDDAFYLCPICGYIHKGEDFEKCPICFCPKATVHRVLSRASSCARLPAEREFPRERPPPRRSLSYARRFGRCEGRRPLRPCQPPLSECFT